MEIKQDFVGINEKGFVTIKFKRMDFTLESRITKEFFKEVDYNQWEWKVWYYFNNVCWGVIYLHNQRIIHSDITANNVFIIDWKDEDKEVKLGGFGVSLMLPGDYYSTYMP